METLKEQLDAKRIVLHSLIQEIRVLEEQVLTEQWKNTPECPHSTAEVGEGKCSFGITNRGIVYCHNINCHK